MGGGVTMSDVQKLLQERVERITTTIKIEEPDRVPITSMFETWAGHYSGYSVTDVAFNYDKLAEAFYKIAEDFEVDTLPPPLGVRCGPIYTTLGTKEFSFFNKDGVPHASIQHMEGKDIMSIEEYSELIKDPYKFIIEKQLPRRYKALDQAPDKKAEALGKACFIYDKYVANAVAKLCGTLETKYGIPALFKSSTEMPLDALMDYFRGFKGVSVDIRRNKEQVIEACEALYPVMLRRAVQNLPSGPFPFIFIPLHIPTYLKPKDFETFYYPTFKRMIEDLISFDLTPALFMEGNWEPYYDYINELPKRKVVGLIEHGDFKKTKDNIGKTITIWGGMPIDVINNSTKEEAIDYAKKLIDDLAPGGGYIFGCDKSLLAPNDANPENLKAVFKFVKEYGVYK
jgi:uroporphyrinogen-III decarboxylase